MIRLCNRLQQWVDFEAHHVRELAAPMFSRSLDYVY